MSILGNARLCRAALALGIVAMAAGDALAWGYRGGSYGSYGSYASYGSSASYGSYGSYGSYDCCGSSGGGGGLFARWHARKAARASYGSYGCCGSSGYVVAYSSYGSYGSYSSCGCSGGVVYDGGVYDGDMQQGAMSNTPPTPPTPPQGAAPAGTPPTPQPDMNAPAGGTGAPAGGNPSASANEATIWVSLPVDAKVFVNDAATKSVGAERYYISRGLEPGRTYSYKLRVEFQRDGQPVAEDKIVRLQGGDAVKLAFGNGEKTDQQSAKTELKLHVPEAAKVTLAGAETKQTGEVRTYATTGLKAGQQWDGYTVRVELNQDGKTLVEEKTLSIEGGKTYELSFDMTGDAPKVASVN